MENLINPGVSKTVSLVVSPEHTALKYGSGLLEVFATPAMVGLMEEAAQKSIGDLLPSDFTTVGIEINVKHIKATPLGGTVSCKSVVTGIDKNKIFFEIKAWDEQGEVGMATHIRYIVEKKKFMDRLVNK